MGKGGSAPPLPKSLRSCCTSWDVQSLPWFFGVLAIVASLLEADGGLTGVVDSHIVSPLLEGLPAIGRLVMGRSIGSASALSF